MAVIAWLGMAGMPAANTGEVDPIAVVRSYFEALSVGDCQRAMALRQPYDVARCRLIRDVRVHTIDPIYRDGQRVAVFIDAEYRVARTLGRAQAETFRGYATLLARGQVWVIDGNSFRSAEKTTRGDYLTAVAGVSTEAPVAAGKADDAAMSRPVSAGPVDSAPRLKASAVPPPVDVGSAAVLDRLWTAEELRCTPAEAKIRRQRPPDRTPPERQAAPSLPPVVPPWTGSIRRVKLPNDVKLVALTFDLCERSDDVTGYDGRIVDVLRAERVPATFYAGGKWMRSHPERTMQIAADPLFEIGNHGWTHGNLRILTGEAAEQQIQWTQAQYALLRRDLVARAEQKGVPPVDIAKIPPVPLTLRFPFGTCSRETLDMAARLGLPAVQWDVVSADASPGRVARQVTEGVLARVKSGSIVVFHANGRGSGTADALPQIIGRLRQAGYRFVTVSDLLRSGEPVTVPECYEERPGDNLRYDKLFGAGTG